MPSLLPKLALRAVVVLPLLLAGCAASDSLSSEDQSQEEDGITENANDKVAFDFFVAKGLSKVQAAGIVGNLDQESSMSPTVWQFGGGPGRGIAQWSAGGRWDHDFHDNVVWYASTKGESKYSLHLQLEFIWYELTSIGYGYSHLRTATSVTSATEIFQDDYEICGACDSSNRIAHAEAALAAYGHDGGGGCVDGGLYCGGDEVSGSSSTLYRCNGSSAPTVVEHCGNGCEVNSGSDDACRSGGSCVVGGHYCGGDKVSGSSSTLYRCTGGSSGTVVSHCASGCEVRPGEDDICR
jgi:Phage tail lysozyme